MNDTLHLLCAGAVQGVVKALAARFEQETGARLHAEFGAVGALKEALLGGSACDVMIVTDAMVAALQASGELAAGAQAALGTARTGLAARDGGARPDVSTAEALKSALIGASALYFPDARRATAGIHFAGVLARLGIAEQVGAQIRNFPNGATSMRELAAGPADAIGCTQITEILYTPGTVLLGALPTQLGLSTVYTACVAARATAPALATRFVGLLAGPETLTLRAEGGFEFE